MEKEVAQAMFDAWSEEIFRETMARGTGSVHDYSEELITSLDDQQLAITAAVVIAAEITPERLNQPEGRTTTVLFGSDGIRQLLAELFAFGALRYLRLSPDGGMGAQMSRPVSTS